MKKTASANLDLRQTMILTVFLQPFFFQENYLLATDEAVDDLKFPKKEKKRKDIFQ